MHWAGKYIGRGYADVGLCWGLVQAVCMERFGEEMPAVTTGSRDDQFAAIKKAVSSLGWRRVSGAEPEADDIVVMTGEDGRHVGFAVFADGEVGVLHAPGKLTPSGPVGSVVFDSWPELASRGYNNFEFWRRSS